MQHLLVALRHTKQILSDRFTDEEGATAVEYGVFAALIIAVLVVTIGLIGDQLLIAFNNVLTELGGTAP